VAARTFDEIAREMGLSPRTVYTLYARAMRKLKRRPGDLEHMQILAAELYGERAKRRKERANEYVSGS